MFLSIKWIIKVWNGLIKLEKLVNLIVYKLNDRNV